MVRLTHIDDAKREHGPDMPELYPSPTGHGVARRHTFVSLNGVIKSASYEKNIVSINMMMKSRFRKGENPTHQHRLNFPDFKNQVCSRK